MYGGWVCVCVGAGAGGYCELEGNDWGFLTSARAVTMLLQPTSSPKLLPSPRPGKNL